MSDTNGSADLADPAEDGATVDALRRGLRAAGAPDGFTQGVMARCAETRRPARRAPSALRRRVALAAGVLVWTAAFAIGLAASEPAQPVWQELAFVRHAGGGDPREQWVRLEMLDDLGHERISAGALAGLASQGYRLEAFWNGEDPRHHWVIAEPVSTGGYTRSGDRYFYIDDDGVIRFSTSSPDRWFRVDESGVVRSERGRAPTAASPLHESGAPSPDPAIGG